MKATFQNTLQLQTEFAIEVKREEYSGRENNRLKKQLRNRAGGVGDEIGKGKDVLRGFSV